jgi:hypothetical protein
MIEVRRMSEGYFCELDSAIRNTFFPIKTLSDPFVSKKLVSNEEKRIRSS